MTFRPFNAQLPPAPRRTPDQVGFVAASLALQNSKFFGRPFGVADQPKQWPKPQYDATWARNLTILLPPPTLPFGQNTGPLRANPVQGPDSTWAQNATVFFPIVVAPLPPGQVVVPSAWGKGPFQQGFAGVIPFPIIVPPYVPPTPVPVVVPNPWAGFGMGGGGAGIHSRNKDIPWETAKDIVRRWYKAIGFQWLEERDIAHMRPSERAFVMDTVAQSPQIQYLLQNGYTMQSVYRLIEDVKQENIDDDDGEAIALLWD